MRFAPRQRSVSRSVARTTARPIMQRPVMQLRGREGGLGGFGPSGTLRAGTQLGGGMRLGRGRPTRTASPWWARLAVLAALAFGASMWFTEIGADLRRGVGAEPAPVAALPVAANAAAAPTEAKADAGPKPATAAAGPAEVAVPRPTPTPAPLDAVRRALLGTSRDHVARGVFATRGSVPDLRAIKGSSVDLVERALDVVDFPLRAALLAHRGREPRRYGLRTRPGAADDAARVLDVANLAVFLDAFAEKVEGIGDVDLQPGDLLLFQRRRGASQFAVVSDRTDARGVTLLYTLDPADRVARDRRPRDDVTIERHWRLDATRLQDARRLLGLPRAARGAAG